MKGFVVYPTYRIEDNKALVYLFGRLENGESFLTINEFKPYFFIKKKDVAKVKKLKLDIDFAIEDSKFKNFKEQAVSKVILNLPKDVPRLRKAFEDEKIKCYEADIRFTTRFLIDNNIKGSLDIQGEHKKGNYVNRIYENPKVKSAEFEPKLKILSIDIETDMKGKEIYSISLYSKDYKKVLIVSNKNLKNAESLKDEKSLLERFKELIIKLDPDIITGWNVIDFDFAKIKERFDANKIDFILGRTEWRSSVRIQSDFFRDSSADIAGRMVLDAIHLLRSSFISLADYRLDTAAQEFLNERKLIDEDNKGEEIERLFKEDPQKLVDYNLKDAELVFKILEKKNIIELTVERSLLTGMELDRVKASIASLDSLYIRETIKKGYVNPSASFEDREERIKGGFVRDSIPGIYDFIIVLDFKSLYPSIIRTFNIDPIAMSPKGEIKAPNNARFKAKDAILPMIIQNLWGQRDKAKKRKDDAASFAIKIHMNSIFGVMANPICRFYSLELANAITHFGQKIVKDTASEIEKLGYGVIYGDTDSVFIETKAKNLEGAKKIGAKIEKYINDYYENLVKKEYKRKSYLNLEFDKCFIRFLMPRIRGSEIGAKKRYAGLLIENGKEKIDFTGLEFVRRDWTALAKKFQLGMFDRIFHKKEVAAFIKRFVDDLKQGKYDDLLVYRKAIRKSLAEYIKTTPPHVKAARKLEKLTSNIIKYVMTENGPEPIQNITSKLDYEHYIEKQIKPLADSVLVFFNQKFDDIIKGSKQTKLFGFG